MSLARPNRPGKAIPDYSPTPFSHMSETTKDFHYEPYSGTSTIPMSCPICGISSFAHSHKAGTQPKDFIITEGAVEEYAIENVETERKRLHSIFSRVISDGETITQEMLDKVILGNRK